MARFDWLVVAALAILSMADTPVTNEEAGGEAADGVEHDRHPRAPQAAQSAHPASQP